MGSNVTLLPDKGPVMIIGNVKRISTVIMSVMSVVEVTKLSHDLYPTSPEC